jgi:hypothetical protein
MTVQSVAQAFVQYQAWLRLSVATTSSVLTGPDAAASDSSASSLDSTSTADSSSTPAPGAASSNPQTPALATTLPAPNVPPPSTVVTLRHVIVNVTTVTYQHLASRAPAAAPPPSSNAAADAPASGPTPAAPDAAATSDAAAPDRTAPSTPSIARLSPDDFAKLRARSIQGGKQATLSLALTTRDGDNLQLDFRQIDTFSRTWLKGETTDGVRVRANGGTASSQRYVDMQMTGDLSDDEKAAIDAMLQNVIDVADQFFHGDMRAAVAHLADMDVDTNQLADVSLKMSMSRSQQLDKVAIGGDDVRVRQAAQASGGVSRTLEYLADQQKQLISAAKMHFDDRSAVKLVTQLLPAMIAPPTQQASTESASVPRDAGSSRDAASTSVAAHDDTPTDASAEPVTT